MKLPKISASQPFPVSSAQRELLELAAGVEHDAGFWRREFARLLQHPAVCSVSNQPAAPEPLTLTNIASQAASRFPIVSGDMDWLRERSMRVVAMRLAPLLAQDRHVAIDLSALTRKEPAVGVRREQMQQVAAGLYATLPETLAGYGVEPRQLTLSVGADHPGIRHLLDLRQSSALGRPAIAIRLPDRLLMALRGREAGVESGWSGDPVQLWQGLTGLAHREPGVRLVLQHTTRPACALAGGERADAVLPLSQFEVRADTAWLALSIRIDAIHAAAVHDGTRELHRLFRAALRLADNLVEQLEWSSAEMAQDALVNRRLAVHVTGIGDLVDRWQLDPADFSTVDLVGRSLGILRRLLMRESNRLARERGPFPGLELRDLATSLARSVGQERAGRLLRQAGLRHRHLLVLSPFGVFPGHAHRRALAAYLNLLPVIRCADTIATHGSQIAAALPLETFRRVLRMTWAIAHNRP